MEQVAVVKHQYAHILANIIFYIFNVFNKLFKKVKNKYGATERIANDGVIKCIVDDALKTKSNYKLYEYKIY